MKIIIKDSNGFKKADKYLRRIKRPLFQNTVKSYNIHRRVKAWQKIQSAIDEYEHDLMENQPRHMFNYIIEEEPRTYNNRLNEGFAMMGQDD